MLDRNDNDRFRSKPLTTYTAIPVHAKGTSTMKHAKYLVFLICSWVISYPAFAQGNFDVCNHSENEFVDWAGGFAMGSTATAAVAGNSYVLVITQSTVAFATTPAIAPLVAGTALTLAGAYGALKVGCNVDKLTDASRAIRDAWVAAASTGMEETSSLPEVLIDKTAGLFCWMTRRC